jgi:ribonuclease HIII
MKISYTFKCDTTEQKRLQQELKKSIYRSENVPHTVIAVSIEQCRINLYTSGKLLVQGKRAKEWIEFVLEPTILKRIEIGYDEILDPKSLEPHMGIDESGKGDFFGPLVIASAYTDEKSVALLKEAGVQDSKRIKSDRKIITLAKEIRSILSNQCAVITIGPESYNRMYSKVRNVNKILAWGHARAIENLLEITPDCPRALSDKFGPDNRIKSALMERGKKILLEQRTKAESDPAVAAASILARAGFVMALRKMEKELLLEIPKGASEHVRLVAENLIEKQGPAILTKTVKCHFKTTDQVLAAKGMTRHDLSPFS